MRQCWLLLLIPAAVAGNYSNYLSGDGLVAAAVEILKDFVAKKTPVVNFIKSVDERVKSENRGRFYDENENIRSINVVDEVIENMMLSTGLNLSFTIQNFDKILTANSRKIEFCVMIVDSHENFRRIYWQMQTETFEFQGYFLIIFIPLTLKASLSDDVEDIFDDLWVKYVANVNILTPSNEDNATIDMFTYFPFAKTYCEEVHPQLYNKFKRSTGFVHQNLPHFPNKVENLHNCTLKISTLEVPPFNMCRLKDSGQWISWGLEGILTFVMSKVIVATPDRVFTHKRSWGNSSAENATEKALEMVQDGKVNMSVGFMTTSRRRQSKLTSSYSYYTTNLVFVIGARKPLTAMQIFSKPLQKAVWGWIVVSILIGFTVAGGIKCMGRKYQNFVFGAKIQHPNLNMMNILLGGTLTRLPTRNFARFILMIFILYALVLRNAYQGALYQFMRMENATQDIRKIKDLQARNYSFYALDSLMKYLRHFPAIQNKTTPLNIKDFEDFRFKLLDASQNLALLASEDHVAYWNKLGYPDIFFHIVPEEVTAVNLCIYLPKYSCLTKEINQQIFNMADNGFMHIFMIQTIDKAYLKRKTFKQEPKKLNLKQLSGGVHLYILGIMMSLLVFCCEIIFGVLVKKMREKFKF